MVWLFSADTGKFSQALVTAEGAAKNTGKKISDEGKKAGQSWSDSAKNVAAFGASFIAFRGITNFISGSVAAANQFESSILGLQSVSQAFIGDAQGATQAAKDLASDGLMGVADSATGLKNLLAAGYGLDEAVVLMNAFKDSAAFGRQGALSFGEAIRGATEGVKNGNSVLVDNAGVTKNLSVILTEAGYSAQDLQKASTDLGVRQAILAGILRETNSQTGDAAKLSDTAAGASSRLAVKYNDMKVKVGQVANSLSKGLILRLGEFVSAGSDTIIVVGTMAAAFIGAIAAIRAISAAIAIMRVVTLALGGPLGWITLALGAIVGIGAGVGMSALLGNLAEIGSQIPDIDEGTENTGNNLEEASKSAKKLAKQLKEINEQEQKVRQDYRESLAQLVQDTKKNIQTLTAQLSEEEQAYRNTYAKRLTDFNKVQIDEEASHEKKIQILQSQIDFLRRYDNESNRRKLAELQFALSKENSLYQTQTDLRKQEYDLEVAAEKEAYEKRRNETVARLNEDTALLDKHKDEVMSIRNVILLDEIQKLKRSRDEQLTSLKQQRKDAIESNRGAGTSAAEAYGTNFNEELKRQLAKANAKIAQSGSDSGKGFWDGFNKWITDAGENLMKVGDSIGSFFGTVGSLFRRSFGFAEGGYTGRGGKYDYAGPVHKGEYVFTKDMVDQASGRPKTGALLDMLPSVARTVTSQASGAINYYVTVTANGFLENKTQQRELADMVVTNIKEMNHAKGIV